jgi:hypothetical protein
MDTPEPMFTKRYGYTSGRASANCIGSVSLYVKISFGISVMKKSSPGKRLGLAICRHDSWWLALRHTRYETFHLIFPHDVHVQCFLEFVIILVGASTCSNNTEFLLSTPIGIPVLFLEPFDEFQTKVYPISLEVDKVQPSAIVW